MLVLINNCNSLTSHAHQMMLKQKMFQFRTEFLAHLVRVRRDYLNSHFKVVARGRIYTTGER